MSNILDNICLQVTGWHRFDVNLRDTNSWLEWTASAYVENNKIHVSVCDNCEDARAEQISNSLEFKDIVANTILQDCPEQIEGYEYGVEYENAHQVYTHESFNRGCIEAYHLNQQHKSPADVQWM